MTCLVCQQIGSYNAPRPWSQDFDAKPNIWPIWLADETKNYIILQKTMDNGHNRWLEDYFGVEYPGNGIAPSILQRVQMHWRTEGIVAVTFSVFSHLFLMPVVGVQILPIPKITWLECNKRIPSKCIKICPSTCNENHQIDESILTLTVPRPTLCFASFANRSDLTRHQDLDPGTLMQKPATWAIWLADETKNYIILQKTMDNGHNSWLEDYFSVEYYPGNGTAPSIRRRSVIKFTEQSGW